MSEVAGKILSCSSQAILEEVRKWYGRFPTDPKMGYLVEMAGAAEAALVAPYDEAEALAFCLKLLDESISRAAILLQANELWLEMDRAEHFGRMIATRH